MHAVEGSAVIARRARPGDAGVVDHAGWLIPAHIHPEIDRSSIVLADQIVEARAATLGMLRPTLTVIPFCSIVRFARLGCDSVLQVPAADTLQELSEDLAAKGGRWLFPKLRRASDHDLADAKMAPEEIVKTWRNQLTLRAEDLENEVPVALDEATDEIALPVRSSIANYDSIGWIMAASADKSFTTIVPYPT